MGMHEADAAWPGAVVMKPLAEKHRNDLAKRQAQAEGLKTRATPERLPAVGELWVRISSQRVYKVKQVDEHGVFVRGIMEQWRGPTVSFMRQFQPLEGE